MSKMFELLWFEMRASDNRFAGEESSPLFCLSKFEAWSVSSLLSLPIPIPVALLLNKSNWYPFSLCYSGEGISVAITFMFMSSTSWNVILRYGL